MPSLALGVRNLSGLNFSGSSQKSGDRCKLYSCNNIQIELTQIRNQFSILKVVRALAYQVDSQSSCKNTRKVLTSSTYRYKEVYSLWYWIPSWITFVPSWRISAPHCHVRRTIIHTKRRPPTIQVITKRSFNTCWLTIDCNAVTKPKQKTIHFDHYIPGSVSGFRERRMSKGGCGYKRNDSATHNLKNLSFHTTNSV